MATIKFYPYKKKENSAIYVRVTIGRKKDIRLSTGLNLKNPDDWDYEKDKPKTLAHTTSLRKSLSDIDSAILKKVFELQTTEGKGETDLSSIDIKSVIALYNGQEKKEELDMLIPFANYFADTLHERRYKRKEVSYPFSPLTISKYKNFARVLEEFQAKEGKPLSLTDVDKKFGTRLANYLLEAEKRSVNTTGHYLKRLKTILRFARSEGFKINPGYEDIEGFSAKPSVTVLSFDEVERIIAAEMPTERLDIARDWLVISCYTGQRISDMFRFNRATILKQSDGLYLSFTQYKTKKPVNVPIHFQVRRILEKYGLKRHGSKSQLDFPPIYSNNEQSNRSLLSKLVKEVCRIAGLRQKVEGRYGGVYGTYPKYKLISNHTGRRSFCTHFYSQEQWPAQVIMAISGHLKEENFLKYIDQEDTTRSKIAMAYFNQMEEKDKKEKSKLIVVRGQKETG